MAVAKELTDLKLQIRVEDGLTSAGAAKIKTCSPVILYLEFI